MERRSFLGASLAAAVGLAGRPLETLAAPRLRRDDGVLRLASNENALGPSEAARRAVIEGLAESNRYTHLVAADLRRRVAAHHGVPETAVVLGNGSAEILQMATQAVARPGGRLIVADPTFEQVYGYGEPWGLERVKVPLTATCAHDIGRMREARRGAGGPVLAYICNPNNPTGSLTPSADVEAWIRENEDTLFLVDEAYFEYADHPEYRTVLPLAMSRPNVVVVRTFSKIYGMAGLRLGYALAHPETAARIDAYAADSNLNIMGLVAARASLGDAAHLARSLRSNEEARAITYDVLDELGLERIPSHTNFVMHRVPGDVRDYIRRMAEHQVRVGRPFPPMTGHNRLSFGLPEEMERFAAVLRGFRRSGWV
ncbi:MAG TPA: histidinol-phosphate transaminase [Longimicrobiales bacterium]|nr:histidinol-phosphate transaminase [Longimicrobiales bacterium]